MFNHQTGQYLEVGSGQIYYELAGSGNKPVLVVLHGGFGTLEDLNPVMDDLSQHFMLLGIDSRGHGKSTMGSEEMTYERLQKDVEKVLKHLDLDKVSLMGFSDGGVVAYRLACFSEFGINSIVTIGSRWHYKNAETTRAVLQAVTADSWKKKFPETFELYQKLSPEKDFDRLSGVLGNMWLDSRGTGYPDNNIEKINCPLLIIRGDNDPLLSLDMVAELKGLVKNSSVLNIPFAGHAPYATQKEIIKISLNKFFSF